MDAYIRREQMALEAAFQLNKELLSDEAFQGYSGSMEQFQLLCQECLYIINHQLMGGPAQTIIDTFYANQTEIAEGNRWCDYFTED